MLAELRAVSTPDETTRMLLMEAIVAGLPDAVVCFDETEKIRFWNRAAELLFGFNQNHADVSALVENALAQVVVKEQGEQSPVIFDDCQWHSDLVLIGSPNAEPQSAIRMSRQISIGSEPKWRMEIFKKPTIEHSAEAELNRLARTDPLSDLFNRRGFQTALESNLNRRLALAIIDVDFFKNINDRLGHEAGDNAIKWIAQKLRVAFPEAVCLGRLGGDEFAVVLDVQTADATTAQFEKFCADVAAEPISWYPSGITISIGVAIATSRGVASRALLTNADEAMYKSKREGRNLVTAVEID